CPRGERQADRQSARYGRPPVRGPLRPPHLRRRRRLGGPGGSGAAMTDDQTRSLLLVVLGATAIWLWWSGQALNYVRPGLVTWLGVGGVVVVLLGLLPPLGLLGKETAGHTSGHHQHRGRVGWLLLVPVLVVMLVQPAALGSYAVSGRGTGA